MFGTTESLERIYVIKEGFMEEMLFELQFEGGIKGGGEHGKGFQTRVSYKTDIST